MGLATGIMVYLIAWWLVFFMALPIGVEAQDEDGGDVIPGTHSSAPKKPMLFKKAIIASLGAALLWGLIYATIEYGWISVRPA